MNGRSARAAAVSVLIVARSAPTNGARSVLLTTRRSDKVIPGPALAGDLVPAGHVDDEDLCVDQPVTEGGREVVPARLDQDEVEAGVSVLERLDRFQVG